MEAFDCDTVTPHVDTPVTGGMGQILATPQSGDRLIFGLFQAGQVGMLDTTDRANLKQLSVVSFGKDTGPHNLMLSSDDKRLVVSDYFLNEDAAGLIHFEGDHKIHVVKVTHDTLSEDTRFNSTSTRPSHRPGASPRARDEINFRVLQCSALAARYSGRDSGQKAISQPRTTCLPCRTSSHPRPASSQE